MKKISIIIPAYNEEAFIGELLKKIQAVDTEALGLSKELIVVDDCSKDKTGQIVREFSQVKYIRQEKNQGKGAAVQRGVRESTGEWFLVQDADLEYDPQDYIPMLKELLKQENKKLAVYGSRTLGQKMRRGFAKHPEQKWGPFVAGQLLSLWTFILYGHWITDTLTAYKLYPNPMVKAFAVKTRGFETDHELTAKLIRQGAQIVEVPIAYTPRTVEEGKKIKARDFFIALWTLLRFRFVS